MLEEISLVIICIFCLVLALISGITTIIKRRERSAIIPLLITILAISGSVYSGVYFSKKGAGTDTPEKQDTIHDSLKDLEVMNAEKDEVEETVKTEADKFPESSFLDSIKTIQPKKKKIPQAYYYSKGFDNQKRMPLIYPYSLVIDGKNSATINNETEVENAFLGTEDSKPIISNVVEFLYNQLFLIGKVNDRGTSTYIFLKFDTGKLISFDTEKAIKKHLLDMGIGYPDKFFTPNEYYARF